MPKRAVSRFWVGTANEKQLAVGGWQRGSGNHRLVSAGSRVLCSGWMVCTGCIGHAGCRVCCCIMVWVAAIEVWCVPARRPCRRPLRFASRLRVFAWDERGGVSPERM